MRLFLALWPPPAVAERLSDIAQLMTRQLGGRPMRVETVHLTLAFLGEVPDERLPELIAVARGVASPSFDLNIDTLGYWRRNSVLWAGPAAPAAKLEVLNQLAEGLQRSLVENGFAVSGWGQPFVPHITLARKIAESNLPSVLPPIEAIRWSCNSFSLVRSQLAPTGSSYERMREFALGAARSG